MVFNKSSMRALDGAGGRWKMAPDMPSARQSCPSTDSGGPELALEHLVEVLYHPGIAVLKQAQPFTCMLWNTK